MIPLPAHPYADLFPMMKPEALAKLIKSIDRHGLREKIDTIKVNGVLMTLDGRNRELACIALNKKPEYKPYKGKDPLAYVMDKNAEGRRHLTPGELADAIAGALQLAPASDDAPTQAEAASAAGISRSTVTRAVRKAKGPEKTSWTIDELKKDEELHDLFTMIAAIYGNDDTRAIRTGIVPLRRSEVATLAKLPKEKMTEIRPLLMANGWPPDKCLKFLNRMPDGESTNNEMQNYCIAQSEKELVVQIGKFDHICRLRK